MKRKLFLVLMVCFVLVFSINVSAIVDYDSIGSITAELTYKDIPLAGSTLTLYRVGDLVWEEDEYRVSLADGYHDSGLPVHDLHTKETAERYAVYTKSIDANGVTQTADENGLVVFSSVPVGVYLISDFQYDSDNLKVDPFLVTVPFLVENEFVYDMNASPKVSVYFDFSEGDRPDTPENPSDEPEGGVDFPDKPGDSDEPDSPNGSDEPDEPEKIPQTGQLKWPAPVLAVSGISLIFVGWWILLDREKRQHEA